MKILQDREGLFSGCHATQINEVVLKRRIYEGFFAECIINLANTQSPLGLCETFEVISALLQDSPLDMMW